MDRPAQRPRRSGGAPRFWLRRSVAVAGVLVLAGVVALAVGGTTPGPHVPGPTTSGPATSGPDTSRPATSAATTTTAPDGPFPVASTTLQLSAAGVTLPTLVRYPARSGGTAQRAGEVRWPLVVFSPGYEIPRESYAAILSAWAAAGYVVAEPAYPSEDPAGRTTTLAGQPPAGPAELAAVIGQLQAATATPGSPLDGLLDPGRVAVAGHSDGGDLALAAAYDSRWRDPAVKAAVIFSGAEYAPFGGTYFPSGSPRVPMLVTQGTADTVNPPRCSVQLYDPAPPPKYYLSLPDAAHLPPYETAGPQQTAIIAVSTAFLDAELKDDPGAVARMQAAAGNPGVASLTSTPSAPSGVPTALPCYDAPSP